MGARSGRSAFAALLAALAVATGTATADGGAVGSRAHSLPATGEALAYWTPARMRAAPPLRLTLPPPPPRSLKEPPTAPSAVPAASASAFDPGEEETFPNRVHGRVFATYGTAGDFTCSGTVVRSPGRSLVVSAAHCIFDPQTGQWAARWIFVPGYARGRAPFGRWVARALDAPGPWVNDENISYDVGTAAVRRNANGRALQDVVGARGIGFGQSRDRVYTSFGYPAEVPFDGETLQACRSPYRGDDPQTDPPRTMRIDCDMGGGSSGGGWVSDGRVLSLNSYCVGLVLVCLDNTTMYGPYFGDGARRLYLASRGEAPPPCAGRAATHLGGRGPQTLRGAGGSDSIRLGRGADTGSSGGGADRLCGGPGPDTLRGGPGRDACVGGPGRDTATGCERTRGVP